MNLLSHLKPVSPLVPCLRIQNLPYCLYWKTRSHSGHNDFIPAAFPPHIISSRHSGQLVWRNLHAFFLCMDVYICPCVLSSSLLPSPFLFCLYRTVWNSYLFHTFSPFRAFAAGSLWHSGFSPSIIACEKHAPLHSESTQFSVHFGGLAWLLLRLPNFALNICRFYLS